MAATDTICLSFNDYEELQKSIALVPEIEEEGVGAVVASCVGDESDETLRKGSVEGYRLARIGDDESTAVDVSGLDFSEILFSIRSEEKSIRLVFTRPAITDDLVVHPADETVEKPETDANSIEEGSSGSQKENEGSFRGEKKIDSSNASADMSSMQQSLFSWTSRVRKSSAQFACEAAQHAAVIASAAKERANAKLSDSTDGMPPESDLAKLFIQSSFGAYLPLNGPSKSKSTEAIMTNTSLIVVRKNAASPCPPSGYTFQWYKASIGMSSWVTLPGATTATLQPSAVDVGCRLRCVVSIAPEGDESDLSDDESSVDTMTEVICQSREVVCAAGPMFNGTQAALGRGAQFGGIAGRGNADGRSFRLKVERKTIKEYGGGEPFVGAAVTIYQVVGDIAEPIHDEDKPIFCVSAETSYTNGKELDIVFHRGIPKSATMVEALATDGKFQLTFPNRLGRESLLLAVGIANFPGKNSELNPKLPLFTYDSPCPRKFSDDSSASPGCHDAPAGTSSYSQEEFNSQSNASEAMRSKDSRCDISLPTDIALQRSPSMDSRPIDVLSQSQSDTSLDLERQVQLLRSRLARREKTISDLQRHASRTETQLKKSEEMSMSLGKQVQSLKEKKQKLQTSLCTVEKRLETQEDTMMRSEGDHNRNSQRLEKEIVSHLNTIKGLERSVKTLENERAVLSAGVEARETKLAKMVELQSSFDELSVKVRQQDCVQAKLQESESRSLTLSKKVAGVQEELEHSKAETTSAKVAYAELEAILDAEKVSKASFRTELETQQMSIQKLKAERNSFKQKGDSLAKEMAKICRNGRTVREVEKIIIDDTARRQEVVLLREQKQKALEDVEHYRIAHEQSRAVQKLAGIDQDHTRMLERNAELERLLTELTEYVSAKEMQLETLKQVNETLQIEIGKFSKAAKSRNLVDSDV